jgi:hypothetical protein
MHLVLSPSVPFSRNWWYSAMDQKETKQNFLTNITSHKRETSNLSGSSPLGALYVEQLAQCQMFGEHQPRRWGQGSCVSVPGMQGKIHHVACSTPSHLNQITGMSLISAGLTQLQARVPALQRRPEPELGHANKEKERGPEEEYEASCWQVVALEAHR